VNGDVERATAISFIEADLERAPELQHVCTKIVEFLASDKAAVVDRLTFGSLARIAGLAETVDVLPAAQYLSSARLHLLVARFEFIDDDSDFIEEINADDLSAARAAKIFYHPQTGKEVPDFEKSIIMFFGLSDDARTLRRAD
jgi:hypothetical protein